MWYLTWQKDDLRMKHVQRHWEKGYWPGLEPWMGFWKATSLLDVIYKCQLWVLSQTSHTQGAYNYKWYLDLLSALCSIRAVMSPPSPPSCGVGIIGSWIESAAVTWGMLLLPLATWPAWNMGVPDTHHWGLLLPAPTALCIALHTAHCPIYCPPSLMHYPLPNLLPNMLPDATV